MKRAWLASLPDTERVVRWVWWLAAVVALPLAVFSWWTFLQAPSRLSGLKPVQGVESWHEVLGNRVIDQTTIRDIVRTPPDWSLARWEPVDLPNFVELGPSVDLPPDAPKLRAWFKIPIPPELEGKGSHGRWGLLGYRIQGGAWSVWVDGKLIQSNLSDWRIQWNVPLRVTVPLGAREVFLAVPYAEPIGYSVGSMFIGPMDVVDSAWQERNVLYLDLPRFMSVVALLLMVVSFHLALSRPKESMFAILGVNALIWSISNLQFSFDVTGYDNLQRWFGSAMDSSITWMVMLSFIFAFDLENIRVPRFKALLLFYATVSTLITLPVWDWQKNALLLQQYINIGAYSCGIGVLGWHVLHHPRREGVVIFIALIVHLVLGFHTLENLTNQTNPDSFYSFSIGTVGIYLAFMYAMSRRTVAALSAAERHEAELQSRLVEQEQRLSDQHTRLQQLELVRSLNTQRETIMQDLHDRLGSNLTSALLQARKGVLSPEETVLLLQDLADELRHVGESVAQEQRSLNELLAELRQRVQNRLAHGGIYLIWEVDPKLSLQLSAQDAHHVLAMLSEAIANVIKHAEASQIRVEARRSAQEITVAITDNGKGFNPEAVEPGRGLPGMRNRAKAIGGALHIAEASPLGCHWQLTLQVPNN
jgi:signal transduction histidine kinase